MISYVIERYVPGTNEGAPRPALSRLDDATSELRTEGVSVSYVGSAICAH